MEAGDNGGGQWEEGQCMCEGWREMGLRVGLLLLTLSLGLKVLLRWSQELTADRHPLTI